MAFKDLLVIQILGDFLTSMKARVLPFFLADDDRFLPVSRSNPFPVEVVAGSTGGGGGSDPASARETTLGEVRDRLPVRPTSVLGRQTLTLTAADQPLAVPAGATGALIGVRGGSASVALAAPAPTATAGLLWREGGTWTLEAYELAALRAVIASGAPVLDVTYVGVPLPLYRLSMTARSLDGDRYSLAEWTLLGEGGTALPVSSPSASSQHESGENPATLAFDANPATWWTSGAETTAYLQATAPQTATGYRITARPDALTNRTPRAWTVQRSLDGGATWQQVHAVTESGPWASGETRTYAIGGN